MIQKIVTKHFAVSENILKRLQYLSFEVVESNILEEQWVPDKFCNVMGSVIFAAVIEPQVDYVWWYV